MKPLLRFEDVTLHRGGRRLFENLNFKLGPGDALHLGGPNGSGKSSLIRLAAGLLRADSGHVERSALVLADDKVALDRELSLKRALSFWTQLSDAPAGLDAALDALGVTALGDVPVRLLSTGQLKRASLARVAMSKAPLWLLDEPFNGLDSDGAKRLNAMIASHRERGGAIVAASNGSLDGWAKLELGR